MVMSQKLKSVELFLSSGLATTLGVSNISSVDAIEDTNTNSSWQVENESFTTCLFLAGTEGIEDAQGAEGVEGGAI